MSPEAVQREPDRITIHAATASPDADCPSCGTRSQRIHSRYVRTLCDLPSLGLPVCLRLTTRRFFCLCEVCPRRTFTERIPELTAPYARRTRRLFEALQALARALGGEGGSRLAHRLGMSISADVLLRKLHRLPVMAQATPRVLGVDDWAWKKGHRYGTILVDLERSRVVDLLPDRTADALAQWLEAHPGVEIITRDRSNLYAEGATRGAPEAVQVADRWHLLRNLTEAIERVLEKRGALLRQVVASPANVPMPADPAPAPPTPRAGQAKAARRARRRQCYEQVVCRRQQGWTLEAIAQEVSLNVRTLRRWLRVDGFPERKERPPAKSKLDTYRGYIDARFQQGCTNAAQLWRELREQGFDGGRSLVSTYVRGLRRGLLPRAAQTKRPTLRRTAWLLTRSEAELGAEERSYVEALTAQAPGLGQVQALAVEFGRLLREHDADGFDLWVSAAEQSPLGAFVASLRTDEQAVRAAVTEPWSNGPVEGQVNRLKLVKRQMYGRASFGLLRARVVEAA